MRTIKYQVSGLSCNACVNRVQTALAPFADSVKVSLKPSEVTLINPEAEIDRLNAALNPIGDYRLSNYNQKPAHLLSRIKSIFARH